MVKLLKIPMPRSILCFLDMYGQLLFRMDYFLAFTFLIVLYTIIILIIM